MNGYRAAVDFGTSYTAAACQTMSLAVPTVLALVDEGRLSSAVAMDEAGGLQAGPSVAEVAALAPDRVERTPKRVLDQPDIMLAGRPVQTADLVAAVLRYVRDELLRQFNGADPEELWLTHPARWELGDPRAERLQAAARQAGFPVTRMLPEPCAAALALAAAGQLEGVGEGALVAVYDLGGGTFDLALLSRAPGGEFALAGEPGGDPEVGGEWLDDRLFERLSGQLPPEDEASLRDPDNSPDPLRWRRAGFAFREGIRRAKERLAREASIQIPLNPPFSLDHLMLSRGELERTATPLITRSADRFELFLQRNGKAPADLAAICLVGGSSRLTVVNRILGQRFDRPIATHGDPKSVTALGALAWTATAASGTTGPAPRDRRQPAGEEAAASGPADGGQPPRAPEQVPAGNAASPEPRPGTSDVLAEGRPAPGERPGPLPDQAVVQQAEALYDEALGAFWTDQFDRAADLLVQVLAVWPAHPAAGAKLEQARQQQELATRYAQACEAADAGDWDRAVAGFTLVSNADADYRDVAVKLGKASEQQQIAALRAEAGRLFEAKQWAAVIKVGERLQALVPDDADPGGVVASAHTELAAAEKAEKLTKDYRAALRLLDAGSWQEAVTALQQIALADPGYRDTAALLARARTRVSEARKPSPQIRAIVEQPKVVLTIRPKLGLVTDVAFSADGRWLASSGTDGVVWILDAATHQEHRRLSAQAMAVMFSADGGLLATCGERIVRIWDTATGEQRRSVEHKSPRGQVAALTLDGRWIAIACPGNAVRVWDAAGGQEHLRISHSAWTSTLTALDKVTGLAFSPDGGLLATASTDATARVWDAASGRLLRKVNHESGLAGVAFSPDGGQLATASTDATACLWDAASGQLIRRIRHDSGLTAVAFSLDGLLLATAATDKGAYIWDVATGEMLLRIAHKRAVRGVALSPGGEQLATVTKQAGQIWALYEADST